MAKKSDRFWTYENRIVLMMFIVFGLVFFERLNILYLFPYMKSDLDLNNTQIGLTVGILGITFGISTMIFSTVSDFIGSKKGMLIFFIFFFAAATFLGGLVGSLGSLLLIRAVMGIAEGPVIPLIHSIVISESDTSRRGRNMGLVQSASNLFGSALAPMIAIAIASTLSWRYAFYITALPAVLMGFILMKALRKPALEQAHEEHAEHVIKPTRKEFMQLFKIRNIRLGMVIATCNVMFAITIGTFAPTLLSDLSGFNDAQQSALLAVLGFMYFAGQAAAPAISDRIGRKPTLLFAALVAIFLPFGFMLLYTHFVLLLIAIVIFGLGNGYQPLALAIIPGESSPRNLAASAIASCLLVSEIIGGSLGPVISGALADSFGDTAAFWVPAFAAVIVLLCSFGVKETAPSKVSNDSVPVTTKPDPAVPTA